MPHDSLPQPTEGELAILRVLWREGAGTVRDVQEHLPESPGYTTVLKLLQIMHDKGLVTRDTSRRAHVYAAAAEEEATQRRLVRDLRDRAFGGSARQLVLRVLDAEAVSTDELEEIRGLLDRIEQKRSQRENTDDA